MSIKRAVFIFFSIFFDKTEKKILRFQKFVLYLNIERNEIFIKTLKIINNESDIKHKNRKNKFYQ